MRRASGARRAAPEYVCMTLLPVWLVTLIAVAAAATYVFGSGATMRSRLVLATVVVLSVVLQRVPGSSVAWASGLIIQLLASIYVLIYFKTAS